MVQLLVFSALFLSECDFRKNCYLSNLKLHNNQILA